MGHPSFYDWRRGPGPFVVSTAVESEVTAPALREILTEIDRIRGEKISAEELSLARDYLEGVFPIRYETTAAIASALATMAIYDLPSELLRFLSEEYSQRVRGCSSPGSQDAPSSGAVADGNSWRCRDRS